MTGLLLAAPILLPLATGLVCALAPGGERLRRGLAFTGALALLAATVMLVARVASEGTQRLSVGGWDAPFGIELFADAMSASMTLITAIVALLALVFQESDADAAETNDAFHPLLFVLLAGVGGTFVTGDLFNLYVWFEVMLLAALGLLTLGGEARNLDATVKYFVLNAIGTIFFLVAVGLVYASTGHLNFAALADAAALDGAARWLPFVSLLTVAFLVKAGAFPVFAWLPASYPVLPAPVLSLFAGLLTKVGVFALLRMLGDVFAPPPSLILEALGWIAALSMVTGALGAIYHWDMRRILAFHIVSQVGYMLFGIALATEGASVATLFYVVHHIAAKSNLFLLAAVVARESGSYDLRRCGGLYAARPGLALLFLIAALSMVGVPPLSGFWAKFMLLREGIAGGRYVWTFAALLTGFLTLYSMMKIWFEAFLKERPAERAARSEPARLGPAYAAIGSFAAITIALGLSPEPVIRYLETAFVDAPAIEAIAQAAREGSR
jgi:multicomponent Na+:H+ antiporter subunit D